MQETLMILSETEEINSLLYKPIIATQRIKYTCLNVSTNYIVLGSSSGSLYLFTREPCNFQQLIPLSEGPVSCVTISPDEKTIALATKRGSVCLVAVKPTVKLLAVSNEHLGELVTSLCWNDNSSEIYVGDGIGKISTMVLSIFTVNGMFQPPSCALMHLDSTIVQMQFSSNLLLISTMTRCYICDTTQEQFKQIGNKARDGEFGACFLEKSLERERSPMRSANTEQKNSSRKGTFNFISDANAEGKKEDPGTKIYCARPGCRLWEVTSNGIVVKTHQFKEALAIPPSPVYKLNSTKQSLNRQTDQSWMSLTVNFSHLYVLCKKYLFSYTSNGLYIIDPTNAAVVLWNNDYINISLARTIGEKIYLMTDSGTFHCLELSSPDSLILHLYENKRYNECLRACNTLRPELLKTIGAKDHQPHQIGEPENTDNSTTLLNNEIQATLVPLISLIQSNLNTQPVKLNSGIVVVNAGNGKNRSEEIRNVRTKTNSLDAETNNIQDTEKMDDDDSVLITDIDPVICDNVVPKKGRKTGKNVDNEIDTESCIDLISHISLNDNSESFDGEKEDSESPESSREIDDVTSNIQTDLNPVYVLINNLKPSLIDSETEEIILNIKKILSDINENYGKIEELKDFLYEVLRATERHYFNVFLDNTSSEFLERTESDSVVNEIFKAFVDVNLSSVTECTCGYSYPKEQPLEPKFLDVGKALLKRFAKEDKDNCIKLCKRVPFMWREYFVIFQTRESILDDIIRVCLQTGDNIVLSIILPLLDVRQWETVVKCLRDVENGICPACGRKDGNLNEKKLEIDWTGVARELAKRDGPSAATTFLVLLETVIPNISLDRSIFQSLIFTKILEHHGLKHTVEFDRNRPGSNEFEAMCSPKIQEQLVEALEKDLERPVDRSIFGIGSHHWGIRFQSKSSACPCCTLSLQTPVLLGTHGISLFPCGHAYHVSCLIQRKLTRCNLHT